MATKVTNQQILNALQAMGLIPAGPIDPKQIVGNQHGEFEQRMVQTYGLDPAAFGDAETIAGKLQDTPPKTAGDVSSIISSVRPDAPSLKAGIAVDPATGQVTVSPPTLPQPQTPAAAAPVPRPAAPPSGADLPQGPQPKSVQAGKLWPTPEGAGPPPGQQPPAPAAGTTPSPTPGAKPGGASGPAGGSVTPPKPVSDADMDAYFKANFGSDAWFMDIPEVKAAVEGAIKKGDTAEYGLHAAQSTNWWKTTSGNARAFQAEMAGDPPTANAKIDAQVTAFTKLAAAQGFNIAPDRLKQVATNSLMYGWTTDQINAAIGAEYQYHTGQSPLAGVALNLKNAANDYIIPISDASITQWGKDIIAGKTTIDEVKSTMAETAKSMYPGLTNVIDRGITVKQYTQPYAQMAGQELDINPDTVDFTDPKWSKALNQVDPKTGERQVMSLADWQSSLRQMPDWQYTQTAHQQVSQLTGQLAQDFGMK